MINIKFDLKTIIIIVLAVIVGGGYFFHNDRTNKLKDDITEGVKLRDALTSEVNFYYAKDSILVAQKKTLQASISTLENKNLTLTDSQKKLINKVKSLDKKNNVITAALIQTKAELNDIKNHYAVIDTAKSTLAFKDSTDLFKYDLLIGNVLPNYRLGNPYLQIYSISMPNEQFVNFQWDGDKRADYPISFSVTNSNKNFKTYNIDSYAIPELHKEEIIPTRWQKIWGWTKKNSGSVVTFGLGVGVGVLLLK